MRCAIALLLLVGCEGLDLASSDDDPLLQRPGRTLTMSVSVDNDNDADLRLYLRAMGSQVETTVDVPPNGSTVAHLECSDGEMICRVFQLRPAGAPDWSRQQCIPCGAGNLRLRF